MERQEFDLNEYSLEVKDGKAVVERKESKKPQVFKLGDVLSNEIGVVVIYAGTNSTGGIVTYSGYRTENGNFTDSKGSGWGYTKEFRYASEEQKKMLFAEIEKRGYVWDAEKLELRKNRWRAKKDERYWIVSSNGLIESFLENNIDWDDELYFIGNYFRTKEQAENVAEEVRKVFEKYKEEQK